MLKLPRKVEYGLISLLHMAELKTDELATSREIAERYHLPPELLGKVLQTLAKAQLIESIQGVKGGYRLNRPLSDIGLGQVLQVLDGPVQLAPCACETHDCGVESSCNIQSPLFHFQEQLKRLIYGLSLDSFLRKEVILQNSFEQFATLEKTL
jgi:Rrf2 family protein